MSQRDGAFLAGYVSIPKAAKQLGYCTHKIRTFINDGLLEAQTIQWGGREVVMVSRVSLGNFSYERKGRGPSGYSALQRGSTISKGYRLIYQPSHHRANHQGYVSEHYLVAEQMLNRPLTKDEVVHHINRDRADNRPENLKIYSSQSEHMSEEHSDFLRYVYKVRGSDALEKKVVSYIKKILGE